MILNAIDLENTKFQTNSFYQAKRSSLDCKEALARADQNSLPDCETTKSFALKRQFVRLKIMPILIILSVGFLFGNVLCSFSTDNLTSLNSVRLNRPNNRLPSAREDNFVSEKYTATNRSNLFYDLSLTNSDDEQTTKDQHAKKPIYFHFISNKPAPSEPVNSKAIHSSQNDKVKSGHKQFNRSKPSLYQAHLQRFMLNNYTAKCNDGTEPGYYFRKGKNSKKWIIFLEGGWFCYSTFSCNHQRWVQMRNFMTSAHLPERKLGKKIVEMILFAKFLSSKLSSIHSQVNGILSNKRDENPFYYNANHVSILILLV